MNYLFLLLPLAVSLVAQPARAGHAQLSVLNGYWSRSAMIFDVIEKQKIHYCLDIADPRFNDDSIKQQTLTALNLWERPMQELGLPSVQHIRVTCDSSVLDLKVTIDIARDNPSRVPYQTAVGGKGNHKYSQVFINTGYISQTEHSYVDFLDLLPAGSDMSAVLDAYSFAYPSTVQKLERLWGLPYARLRHSTYPLLIHEIGHAFGMCDTYKEGIALCDPTFNSGSHPSSVMQDAWYLYLTEDDRLGIQALYRRFKDSRKK